jgi:hypothetical protein
MASIARGRQGGALVGAALRQLVAIGGAAQPAGAASAAQRVPAALGELAAAAAARDRCARTAATAAPWQLLRGYGTLVQFPLAQTGEGISECELVQWFVKVGAAGRLLRALRLRCGSVAWAEASSPCRRATPWGSSTRCARCRATRRPSRSPAGGAQGSGSGRGWRPASGHSTAARRLAPGSGQRQWSGAGAPRLPRKPCAQGG